jgi:hypothetical protein
VTVPRRFPPPWTVEEHNDSCFTVKDGNGFSISYVYFESEPGRRAAAKLLTSDEARRMAAASFAELPERCGRIDRRNTLAIHRRHFAR